MRLGYIVTDYPPLSETFIRREIQGLCRAGERVFVYTNNLIHEPLVPDLAEPNLTVRNIPFRQDANGLIRQAREDGIEHFHATLMLAAHRRAWQAAQALGIPFSLTAYSGHDIFTVKDSQFYRPITNDPLCAALIVEDPFMQGWVINRLGANPQKLAIIANSFDMELYRRTEPYRTGEPLVILSIARFVEKKGLAHLILAFNRLCQQRRDVELWLVGSGIQEPVLRRAARANHQVKFLGRVSEAETRRLYQQASIFCLPCVRASDGDADGVPTTILEALAFEVPVVSSDLLSMSYYVRPEQDGLLIPPGNEDALFKALERLCADGSLRQKLGQSGRQHIHSLCNQAENLVKLQRIIQTTRRRMWQEKLQAVDRHRQAVTSEKEAYYIERRKQAVEFFQPAGRLLEIGCSDGRLRKHLPADVTYFGCDPLAQAAAPRPDFPCVSAAGEHLPYPENTFDSVVLYAVLAHVESVDSVLAEARRVLKTSGRLFLQECYNDPNPIHLNHFSTSSLRQQVSEFFEVEAFQPANEYLMLVRAVKPEPRRSTGESEGETLPGAQAEPGYTLDPRQNPLVSIAITAYNRAGMLGACIDSVLNQTYRPLEVIVVDDGSTDGTSAVLEQYKEHVRAVYNDRNRGRVFSKNLGLRLTSPEAQFVAILDSDDAYRPNFVERCVAHLVSHPEHGLVYTDDILVDSEGREIARQAALEPWNLEKWLRTRNLRGDTWLARRDLVMQTRLHDEDLELDEDYDLFYQLLEITTFGHVPEYLAYIRRNDARSTQETFELAKCHAANLVKYGFSSEYAYLRARQNPEWVPAIKEGVALGQQLRQRVLKGN